MENVEALTGIWPWVISNSNGIIAVFAIIGPILGFLQFTHSNLLKRINERFDHHSKYMDARFNAMDQRLNLIDGRLEKVVTEAYDIGKRVSYNEGMVEIFRHQSVILSGDGKQESEDANKSTHGELFAKH